MPAHQNIVWDAITDSAKTRFDFQGFSEAFTDLDDVEIVDNLLFKVIVGLTDDQRPEEIAAGICRDFLLQGVRADKDSLLRFVEDRSKDLRAEILATRVAIELLEIEWQPPEILIEIQRILGKPVS